MAGVSVKTVNEQKRIRELDPELADKVAAGKEKATTIRRQVLGKYANDKVFRYAYNLSQRHTKFMYEVLDGTGVTPERFLNGILEAELKRHERTKGTMR